MFRFSKVHPASTDPLDPPRKIERSFFLSEKNLMSFPLAVGFNLDDIFRQWWPHNIMAVYMSNSLWVREGTSFIMAGRLWWCIICSHPQANISWLKYNIIIAINSTSRTSCLWLSCINTGIIKKTTSDVVFLSLAKILRRGKLLGTESKPLNLQAVVDFPKFQTGFISLS